MKRRMFLQSLIASSFASTGSLAGGSLLPLRSGRPLLHSAPGRRTRRRCRQRGVAAWLGGYVRRSFWRAMPDDDEHYVYAIAL